MADEPSLRLARTDELGAIEALMKASTRELFARVYDEEQTAAGVEHIAVVDRQLVEDGTYFVLEVDDEIVACGGWSRRDKLYTGSGEGSQDARLLDPATEPARVRAMFVRADWTRRGLGTRILVASEDAARAEGFTELALMSTAPGVPLYEHYGFTVVDRTEILTLGGTALGGAEMIKPIDPGP